MLDCVSTKHEDLVVVSILQVLEIKSSFMWPCYVRYFGYFLDYALSDGLGVV